jgi:DnaK suppressor protein
MKKKSTSASKKQTKAKAAKKPVAKKAAAKKVVAKKAAPKKPVKKSTPAKAKAKVVPKKAVKKVAPKKAAAKKVTKKAAPKKVTKKVVKKSVAKKVVKKAAPKKAAKKVAPKKIVKKIAPKKVAKVAKKVTPPAKKTAPKKVVAKVAPKVVEKKITKPVVTAKPVISKPQPKVVEVKKKVIPPPRMEEEDITPEPKRIIEPKFEPKRPAPIAAPAAYINGNSSANSEKTRYSDAELQEFKDLIMKKLTSAKEELILLTETLSNPNGNGTDDTAGTFKVLEDGSATLEKEHINQLAARQRKFVDQLEAALVRIENKTYGICRETGKLIPKERLRAVPHTTLSMEAKMKQM